MVPLSLDRVSDMITASFSRPWNPSTVCTSKRDVDVGESARTLCLISSTCKIDNTHANTSAHFQCQLHCNNRVVEESMLLLLTLTF